MTEPSSEGSSMPPASDGSTGIVLKATDQVVFGFTMLIAMLATAVGVVMVVDSRGRFPFLLIGGLLLGAAALFYLDRRHRATVIALHSDEGRRADQATLRIAGFADAAFSVARTVDSAAGPQAPGPQNPGPQDPEPHNAEPQVAAPQVAAAHIIEPPAAEPQNGVPQTVEPEPATARMAEPHVADAQMAESMAMNVATDAAVPGAGIGSEGPTGGGIHSDVHSGEGGLSQDHSAGPRKARLDE